MKYLSIDLETTGLDPENNQILEFGAVIEDTNNRLSLDELPTFHTFIDNGDLIQGNAYALQMNSEILKKIATKEDGYNYVEPRNLGWMFHRWLMEQGFKTSEKNSIIKITVAGKNFGAFDLQFLNNCENFNAYVKIDHRIIDPGTLCVDWVKDEHVPGLNECKARHGIDGEVTHNAVEDAIDVIKVLRKFY